jgi:pSer/pThr/pTyr-binding forkhead associated (FHA) protein
MQGNDSYRLIVRRGPQPNQTYDLTKDITTLGRDITNDIVINDPEVSRHHLRFIRGTSGFTLEDLGSTNGTFINGQRMTGSRPLNHGDMIGLGETVTLGYERARPVSPVTEVPGAAPGMTPPPAQSSTPSYSPPQQSQPAQQHYQAPQPPAQQEYGAPSSGYSSTPSYGSQQGYGAPQAPPAGGYDYDPYAIREDEPRSAIRWVLIGCLGLSVFCCCTTGVSLVIIDTLNLWYDLPIISQLAPLFERIASALGLA